MCGREPSWAISNSVEWTLPRNVCDGFTLVLLAGGFFHYSQCHLPLFSISFGTRQVCRSFRPNPPRQAEKKVAPLSLVKRDLKSFNRTRNYDFFSFFFCAGSERADAEFCTTTQHMLAVEMLSGKLIFPRDIDNDVTVNELKVDDDEFQRAYIHSLQREVETIAKFPLFQIPRILVRIRRILPRIADLYRRWLAKLLFKFSKLR